MNNKLERSVFLLIIEKVSTLKINRLSKAQYERESEAGRLDATALYLTPDEAPEIIKLDSQEEYDNAVANGTILDNVVYLIPDKAWTKAINDSKTITVTVEDFTEYYFPNATNVTVNLPTDLTNYECWIFVGKAATITVNGGVCLGIAENSGSASCAEVSIKDGRYLIAKVTGA